MIIKKLLWTIKRHPFLYLTRFRLLSKNRNVLDIENFTYNAFNKKSDIPSYFVEINNIIFQSGNPNSDFDRAKKLSLWLFEHIKGGPGLSEPSGKALKIMLYGKGGVCSDMVQSFNNFCVLNDIQVREWGTTRAPYDKNYGGHSFNEVYSKELKKWILIDVSCCVFFYCEGPEPLSVIELFQKIKEGRSIYYRFYNQKKQIDETSIERNYLNPNNIPFLVCNYSNKVYDISLERLRPFFPVFFVHFLVFLIGKSYHYCFPLNDYRKIFA